MFIKKMKYFLSALRNWSAGGVLIYGIGHKITYKLYLAFHSKCRGEFIYHSFDENKRFRIINNLRKHYKNKIQLLKKEAEDECVNNAIVFNKNIWIMWWQGMDNAPATVKKCYESVVKNLGNEYKITVITKDNYKNYVSIPQDIEDKILNGKFYLTKGQIPIQFLSDLIRLGLLINYGGIWMDATIYCTSDKLPDYMVNSDLFLYQILFPYRWCAATTTENWFISAKSNQLILRLIQKCLFDYIRFNSVAPDYLFYYCFMELVKENCPKEWGRIVPVSNTNVLCLQDYLFKPFDKKIYDVILNNSVIHKLTWKFAEGAEDIEGTFYKYIMEENNV